MAARPHGSNGTSRECPVGPHEPYWRTNTSFSPPPPRWDYRLQSEGTQYGSNDSIPLFGSTSSNSKESRSWLRGGYHPTPQYSASESGVLFVSSPSDTSLIQPWTPPPFQGINIDDYEASAKRDQTSGRLSLTPTMEGTSMVPDSGGSISSRSDVSVDFTENLSSSTPRNIPSLRSFISKPIRPLSFPLQAPTREASGSPSARFTEYYAATQKDTRRLSSDSIDLNDISELYDPTFLTRASNPGEVSKCGLCDRLLSQRSPWSFLSGDMPITGVLSCSHVFHADCLEKTTPKSHSSDPPCPICSKVEREISPKQVVFSKLRNVFPRCRPVSEEGSSRRSWGCVQAGDCVEGALHTPQKSSMLVPNRNRMKKNLSLKGNSSKDFSGKSKKSGSFPLHIFGGEVVDHEVNGRSKAEAGHSMK